MYPRGPDQAMPPHYERWPQAVPVWVRLDVAYPHPPSADGRRTRQINQTLVAAHALRRRE